jgi:hypothetical protein
MKVPLIRSLFGPKPVSGALSIVNRAQYFRLLGFAIDSMVTNLTQGVNTLARYGLRDTLTGYIKLASDPKTWAMVKDEQLTKEFESFVQGPSDVWTKGLSWLEKGALKPFSVAEFVNRGAAFAAGIESARRKGLSFEESIRIGRGKVSDLLIEHKGAEGRKAFYSSEALEHARSGVLRTQFGYSPTEASPMFSTPTGRALLQFWTYPTQQGAVFWDNVVRAPLPSYRGAKTARQAMSEAPFLRHLALLGMMTFGAQQIAQLFGLDVRNVFSFWGIFPQGFGPNAEFVHDLWGTATGDWASRQRIKQDYGHAIPIRGPRKFIKYGPAGLLPVRPYEPPGSRSVNRDVRRAVDRGVSQ